MAANNEIKKPVASSRGSNREKRAALTVLLRLAAAIIAAAIILLNLFTHVLQVVNYNGSGMEPNLESGQTLVLLKTKNIKEGDVIAFYYNNQVLVRRVICDGGKQLSIRDDGTVLINSQELEEKYLAEKSVGQCDLVFPYHVRTGTVFVMGDNRDIAMDSRLGAIGTIPLERVIGKVIISI